MVENMTKDELIEIACAAWRSGAFPEHFPWEELSEETKARYRVGMLAALQEMAIATRRTLNPEDIRWEIESDVPVPPYKGMIQALKEGTPQGS